MGSTQSPEILYDAWLKCKNKCHIDIHFVGNTASMIKRRGPMDGAKFPGYLLGSELSKYLKNKVDVAFFSLSSDYLGLCVPSKFFDYINYELPIIASLPKGDVRDYIIEKEVGIVCNINEIQCLANSMDDICDKGLYEAAVKNIQKIKPRWLFNKQQQVLVDLINDVADAHKC